MCSKYELLVNTRESTPARQKQKEITPCCLAVQTPQMKMAGIMKKNWRKYTHIQTPQMKMAERQTSDPKPLLLCTSKMEAVELEANVRVEEREREWPFVGEFVQGREEDVCVAGKDEREGLESQEQVRVLRERERGDREKGREEKEREKEKKEREQKEKERDENEREQREIEEAKEGLERVREQEAREREQQVLLERVRVRESMEKEREEHRGEGQARERQSDRTLAAAQVCWFSL